MLARYTPNYVPVAACSHTRSVWTEGERGESARNPGVETIRSDRRACSLHAWTGRSRASRGATAGSISMRTGSLRPVRKRGRTRRAVSREPPVHTGNRVGSQGAGVLDRCPDTSTTASRGAQRERSLEDARGLYSRVR